MFLNQGLEEKQQQPMPFQMCIISQLGRAASFSLAQSHSAWGEVLSLHPLNRASGLLCLPQGTQSRTKLPSCSGRGVQKGSHWELFGRSKRRAQGGAGGGKNPSKCFCCWLGHPVFMWSLWLSKCQAWTVSTTGEGCLRVRKQVVPRGEEFIWQFAWAGRGCGGEQNNCHPR